MKRVSAASLKTQQVRAIEGALRRALRTESNPFSADVSQLKLLETESAPLPDIVERMLNRTYCKPYIVDDGILRYLHFDPTYVQSAMRIDEPDVLDLRYTKKMMGFLLFNSSPRQVTILGLGGGSLAKFCYRHLPNARITVVEIDPNVIALRDHFLIPTDNARFSIVCDDAAHFVAQDETPVDTFLVDTFDAHGLAKSVATQSFFRAARDRMSKSGVFVMNLAGSKEKYSSLIADARLVFEGQVWVIPVSDDGNYILFALADIRYQPNWHHMRDTARALRAIYHLDFPTLVKLFFRFSRRELRSTAFIFNQLMQR